MPTASITEANEQEASVVLSSAAPGVTKNKHVGVLAAVLFQVGQYTLIRQIQLSRMLPVAA